MRGWEFPLPIDPQSPVPLFVQIARAISDDVRRGRLRPGDAMPGTRSLARTLGVHRNTVIAAYDELAAEGWITTENGRGTFVSDALPDPAPRRFATRSRTAPADPRVEAFDLGAPLRVYRCPGTMRTAYNLAGWPDVRLVPTRVLGRAWRRAVERHASDVLSYGSPEGHPRLRAALAAMLSATRGLAIDASQVLVTRGTQGALAVIAHALFRPGDTVAIEDPGYRRGWQTLGLNGARLLPIGIDRHGLLVDDLAAHVAREPIKAVYVTPHHQFPTTATLSAARRLRLLDLARRGRFAIIEDDYDHEFHYDGRPILPLASADAAGSVIYVGSLSKTLAPGLRLGYIVAARHVVEHLTEYRSLLDTQGDAVLETAVAELLEEGEMQRHVRRTRRLYHVRRDALAAMLTRELGGVVTPSVPSGGTALWVDVDPEIDVERWAAQAFARGVVFEIGRNFSYEARPLPYIRVGFAGYGESELAEAVRLMARCLPRPADRSIVELAAGSPA